jgi:hypothetical protein
MFVLSRVSFGFIKMRKFKPIRLVVPFMIFQWLFEVWKSNYFRPTNLIDIETPKPFSKSTQKSQQIKPIHLQNQSGNSTTTFILLTENQPIFIFTSQIQNQTSNEWVFQESHLGLA